MPPRSKNIRLFLLGAPRLEAGGQPAALDTRKALALLAYLALSERSATREKLAAFFWPDADDARAHGALRRTLSVLNTALGGAGLTIDRETVAVSRGLWSDVVQFRQLAGQPADIRAWQAALALYQDDFMAGFTLRDSPAFDDWQYFQREGLRRELAAMLERLVSALTDAGDYAAAIAHCRRWLTLDPVHEPAHRALMQLYAWAGQRSAALRQYQECARVLAKELGVAPLEATTGLFEAIKANRAPAEPPSGAPRAAPAPARQPSPLVGRAGEWQALQAAYEAARAGGQCLALEGEAGIGKTRLAEEFVRRRATGGARLLTARCYAGQADLAYAPFVEALRTGLSRPGAAEQLAQLPEHFRAEAARLLPELLVAPPPALEGPGAQSRFFEGVRQALLALAAGAQPGIFFVDDAHWADEASLDLLAYLIRRLRETPLLVVLTWRAEDLPAQHRLRAVLAEAQRLGGGALLALRRLGLSEVRELAQAALPAAALSETLAERLYQETEGTPLFVAEYLTALANHAPGEAGWEMPAGVRELLSARLAGVGETAQQVLSAAAVLGRSFDVETVQAVSGRSDDETVQALEELAARRLVGEVPGPAGRLAYDFSHDKLRGLAYDRISLARRRLLHRRAAEALAAHARRQPAEADRLAGQIAQHYRLGGAEAEAAAFHARAGDQARRVYANAEALAHYRAALALGHPAAQDLHEAIGDLSTLAGDYAGALASYEAAAARGDQPTLARLEHKLANVYDRRGEWDLADSHFRAALELSGDSAGPGQWARLCADWGRAAHHAGRAGQALDLAERALAEAAGDARALALAHNLLGLVHSRAGAHATARRHLEASVALAKTLADPDAWVAALNNLALACRTAGDLDQAVQLVQEALKLCATFGDRHRQAALHNNLADLYHALGQEAPAMSHLKQAVALFAEVAAEPDAGASVGQPEIWKLTEW